MNKNKKLREKIIISFYSPLRIEALKTKKNNIYFTILARNRQLVIKFISPKQVCFQHPLFLPLLSNLHLFFTSFQVYPKINPDTYIQPVTRSALFIHTQI